MYLWHIIVDCKNHLYLKTGCEKKFADLSARQVDIVDSKYIQVGRRRIQIQIQYNTMQIHAGGEQTTLLTTNDK